MWQILNAIFYVLRRGIGWRLIPKGLPPRSTMYGYLSRWHDTGLYGQINYHFVMEDRERVERTASLSAAVLDRKTRQDDGERRAAPQRCWQEGHGPQASSTRGQGWT